jgi:hypothetical protein
VDAAQFEECAEGSSRRDDHATERDGCLEHNVLQRECPIRLGDQFRHDELPRGKSVRFGLLAVNDSLFRVLRATKRIECKTIGKLCLPTSSIAPALGDIHDTQA